MTISGVQKYLWRVVDQNGNVLEILLQNRRDEPAARRFFRKLLKKTQPAPRSPTRSVYSPRARPVRSGWPCAGSPGAAPSTSPWPQSPDPVLAEHLPDRLDARALEHVSVVQGDGPCRYVQRLGTLHTLLVQSAAGSERYEPRRSAEVGQHLLWEAASLLQIQDTRTICDQLIARERLMLQLAHKVAQIVEGSTPEDGAPDPHQTRGSWLSTRPYPRDDRPTFPSPHPSPGPSLLKRSLLRPEPEPRPAVRTPNVYLPFAREPYYPGSGTEEINSTVVLADSLHHPQVRQPGGIRIHELFTQGRQPGEVIPLTTLIHELNGGTDWPKIGDWEGVTTDLVQLIRPGQCDALSLGLHEIARGFICTGPHGHVHVHDTTAGWLTGYGPAERAAVLAEVDKFLPASRASGPCGPVMACCLRVCTVHRFCRRRLRASSRPGMRFPCESKVAQARAGGGSAGVVRAWQAAGWACSGAGGAACRRTRAG